jgi:hypothetical protein
MAPAHDELCHAIIVLGSGTCGMGDVEPATLHRLAELGLAQYESPGWTLTKAGLKLLPMLTNGDEIEPLA